MAYIHEAQLAHAMKNLYALGNRPISDHEPNAMAHLAGTVGGMAVGLKQSADAKKKAMLAMAAENLRKQNEAYRDDYASQMRNFQYQNEQPQKTQEQYNKDLTKIVGQQALTGLELNDTAETAPFAGQWTPRGNMELNNYSDVNANDIMKARAMVRMGMPQAADDVYGPINGPATGSVQYGGQ